jgi:hypothetical protein
LAVTYDQLRTGRLPFTGSIGEVLDGHLHRPPDLSGLPDGERQVVGRALAKCPKERWPSCREFVRQLERVAAHAETHSDRTVPLSPGYDKPADVKAESGETGSRKEAAPRDESGLAGCRDRRSSESRPRRFGRVVAMGLGIIGLTAILSASLVPSVPSSLISRAPARSGPQRRRGHGFPFRHVPGYPRSPHSGRRARNQTQGGNPSEIRQLEVLGRGGNPPSLGRNARCFVRPQAAVVRHLQSNGRPDKETGPIGNAALRAVIGLIKRGPTGFSLEPDLHETTAKCLGSTPVAQRPTPPDPKPSLWGLAGYRQLGPSPLAFFVTREGSDVEPCPRLFKQHAITACNVMR